MRDEGGTSCRTRRPDRCCGVCDSTSRAADRARDDEGDPTRGAHEDGTGRRAVTSAARQLRAHRVEAGVSSCLCPRSGSSPSLRCTTSRYCGAMSQGRSGSTRTRRTRPEACARRSGASDGWASGSSRHAGSRLELASAVAVDVRAVVAWARRVLDPATELRGGRRRADLAARDSSCPIGTRTGSRSSASGCASSGAHALEALCHRLTTAGRFGEATEAGLAAVRDEPLRESAHRVLIGVHLAEGNRAAALHQYRAFALLLHEEVGMSPTSRMEQLMESITAR